ncbi:NAD-dependent epimerase/dehydratase family protein [Lysinibacillus sp. RSDA_15]|uniref:NAD-dependent epimerase/dehydratase family protein n=1 Tax=Lysinibacillus TaxID=400634 RepID=UPI0004DF67E3|nr:NAD-dependent epimerase/dehydratase family protein [Lysinibacillus sphaericus]MBG9756255.1 NAD-dependent dehydratase [Lysinibacillus sphaericus]PIJ97674.1 NAD-dependent dehydratase [Lysinibacillus sphaericus]QPA53561.1 NAD-dependent epimerase/dehydratase family protein [Lysinibacillus sphaericus]QPA57891.1 NAD-dependent epimerase/dehydratase family protein [Lysinibacillus sphaericus]QTB12729.1 NAD-dependent epimerase/dehydratase family protein [Lysinibacillus sphaericus]
MNILVLGGTRFFGKKLVELCIENGHDVTILTRGQSGNPFGTAVKQLIVNRDDRDALENALAHTTWDIVYDNICYSPNEAHTICELLKGKTKKLVFTSTLSTYEVDGKMKKEEDFDPYHYQILMGDRNEFSYGEGKRQAEAVLFKEASFPVVAVRFPIVMGEHDYTRRLHFHVERILHDQPISLPNIDAQMSYITDEEAANFLYFAGMTPIEGPYNATASGAMSLKELLALIEEKSGKRAKISLVGGDEESQSPYGVPADWYMTNAKAEKAGFTFSQLHDWLPKLVNTLVKQLQ